MSSDNRLYLFNLRLRLTFTIERTIKAAITTDPILIKQTPSTLNDVQLMELFSHY
jgi:hypothetical protein